jgi:hypothetical protein
VSVRRGQTISDRAASRAFFIVGALMLAAACAVVVARAAFALRAVTAVATVAARAKHSGRHGTVYCPILSFAPEGATAVEVQSNWCTSQAQQFVPGQRVEVLYDPGDPQTAEIAGQLAPAWVLVPILAPMGLAFLGGGWAFRKRSWNTLAR